MKYLAFDQASRLTGYVIVNRDPLTRRLTLIEGEVIDYKKIEDHTERLFTLFQTVLHMIATHNPDVVVVEDIYLGRNVKTFEKLAKVQAVIQVATLYSDKQLETVSPATARGKYNLKDKKDTAVFICEMPAFESLAGKKLDITDAALLALYVATKE